MTDDAQRAGSNLLRRYEQGAAPLLQELREIHMWRDYIVASDARKRTAPWRMPGDMPAVTVTPELDAQEAGVQRQLAALRAQLGFRVH